MKKIIIVTLLSWFPLIGSELKPYFDKQGDINPASLSTRSSIKRQHRLCFDYGDELLGAKRFVSAELEDNMVEHALSFDAQVLLSLDESVFAGNDEGHALTSDSIHGHDFLEPDPGLEQESPSVMFEDVISQVPTVATDMPTHESDETAPKENESLELALSNEKVWKKISYNSYTCIPCNITISFSSQLSAHTRSHKHRRALGLPKLEWNQRKYTCEICKLGWDELQSFTKHKDSNVHKQMQQYRDQGIDAVVALNGNRIVARTLQEVQKNNDLLKEVRDRSIWKKNRDKGYTCILCKVKLICLSEVSKHIQSHKHGRALGLSKRTWNKYPHICKTCKKGFALQFNLKKHEDSDEHRRALGLPKGKWDQYPHICKTCKKGFALQFNLKTHEDSDEHYRALGLPEREWDQYPHICKTCKKGFAQKYKLKKHEGCEEHQIKLGLLQ